MQLSCRKLYIHLRKVKNTLKKKANITLLIVSVLVLLIAPFIPHHHHEGMACVVIDCCEQDNFYSEEHTEHSTEEENSFCTEHAEFLTAKSNSIVDFKNVYLFSLLVPTLGEIFFREINNSYCNDDFVWSKYIGLNSSNSLRAPPNYLI